ncbi:MAG: alpha/beta hydrolase [Saprospiraceae bacterium]|nr:alpha/beta hydrolase [Saprospiraceae bacterium]
MPSTELLDWKKKGNFLNGDHRLFYLDINPTSEKVILIFHGYPTCSYDYYDVVDQLSEEFRVIIPDFLGFGLSAKPAGHNYLLTDQADLMVLLLKSLNIKSLNIIAHDYGTSVFTEILARSEKGIMPFAIRHATLCNGSMLIHLSQLRPIQRLLKNPITGPLIALLSNEKTFHRNMKNIWGDPSIYNVDKMKVHWEMLKYDNGKKRLPRLTQYINQRYQNYDRWIGALKSTDIPIDILWAEEDPVAVIEMAYQLEEMIPNNRLTTMKGIGHYPMIEQPGRWSDHVLSGLE